MLLTCAVIDDDKVFSKIVEHYISKVNFIDPIGFYNDAESAANSINFETIDFLFLDVEMPGMSGIEFLETLNVIPPVVFVSQNKEYGVDAYNFDAIDYLHKPVSFFRFLKSTNKIKYYFQHVKDPEKNKKNSLFVKHNGIWMRIPLENILYINANNNNVLIKTAEKSYKSNLTLKDICVQLPDDEFMQIHRSYIVHLSKINKLAGEIVEVGSHTIPVSKPYIKALFERLHIRK